MRKEKINSLSRGSKPFNPRGCLFTQFREKIAEVGVMKFATYPPIEIETSIHKLWDIHCPSWRKSASKKAGAKSEPTPKPYHALLRHLEEVQEKSQTIDPKVLENMDEADYITVSHMVPVQRGSWRILPKRIENKKSDIKS